MYSSMFLIYNYSMKHRKVRSHIYKFKTLKEQNEWELKNYLEKGKDVHQINRFENIRLRVKIYSKGIYKFKTLEEKWEYEFQKVMEMWYKRIKGAKS